jgi:hypothetical protein
MKANNTPPHARVGANKNPAAKSATIGTGDVEILRY